MKFSENSLFVAPTPLKLAEELAGWFYSYVFNHKNQNKQYYIAISSGSTPVLFFDYLSSHFGQFIDWKRIHVFWVDEKCVSPDSAESHFHAVYQNFLRKVNFPEDNIHRICGENNPQEEAQRYSNEITSIVPTDETNVPSFDLILLGIGNDGSTASIFPTQNEIIQSNKFVEVSQHNQLKQKRITITPLLINRAHKIIFHVTGFAKASIVSNILQNKPEANQYPASFIKPKNGDLYWFLDAGAAKDIFK